MGYGQTPTELAWFLSYLRFCLAAAGLWSAVQSAQAQWKLQVSNTTVSLRGISSIGQGIAWASGAQGTILRTEDGGTVWRGCATPPGAETLDFRGVQALGKDGAVVMSSGKDDLSRVFETTDGCHSWKLLLVNADGEGFFDSILYDGRSGRAFILGDPVDGFFKLFSCDLKMGACSSYSSLLSLRAAPKQAAFAASNSLLTIVDGHPAFITGGSRSEWIGERMHMPLPFASGESSGAFSAATDGLHIVVVGGDYKLPNAREHTAAFSRDGGRSFSPAKTMPGGYRSAVAYDPSAKRWIAAGPNGTDVSTDDGRHWRRLFSDGADDKEWNAVSLPFVVGAHGRIAKLPSKASRHEPTRPERRAG